MDDLASFTHKTSTMFGSTSLTAMDDSTNNFSLSNPSDSSSSYLNSSETYLSCLYPNLSQRYFEQETDVKPYPLSDTLFNDQTPRKRLIQAIQYLKDSTTDVDLLIQLWLPVQRGGECILATEDQPFILNSQSKGLLNYREISKSQVFATDDDSEAFFGLPSLVFLKKFPMCTPRGKEDRNQNAHQLNLCGFLHIPVFELGSGTCLGVIEIVTTSQYVNYHDQLNNICTALEVFDLRSSEFLIHPKIKDYNGSYEVVLAEIRQVLKSVCETHCLPLAQTWSICAELGRGGCPRQSAACISVISSASYVFDPYVLGFYEACSELHLLQGEGIAGKALLTNQPCFATDITAFCTTEYPLAEHAKLFGLGGAVAIRLHSTYMESIDFILEFFLPHDCRTDEQQKQMLSSISYVMQHVSKSLHVINDEDLADEVKETRESCWISRMLEAQERGESFTVSMGSHKEEPHEFQVINQYATLGCGDQIQPDTRPKRRRRSSVTRRSDEKKRAKAERNISLSVLQQYFHGSLKDAAKNIGVCPTTLKRICREHGVMRWPSRKIKKVGHSLKKLQLIIDSVQGAEGTIQLGSFYTNFPELSAPIKSSPKPTNDFANLFTSASCSSSRGSHNSGSSLCCSQGNTSHTEKPGGLLKKTAQDERKPLVRTHRDNHHSHNCLRSSPVSRDEGAFQVKVVYGEQKTRLSMSQHGGFEDLQREILRRFSIHDMNSITLKYLDDDSEWVLLTCDADLEECMDINIASKSCTIKLFLHPSFHLEPGSPFTSNDSS